jgi:Domain of Unknown Function (DUF928)
MLSLKTLSLKPLALKPLALKPLALSTAAALTLQSFGAILPASAGPSYRPPSRSVPTRTDGTGTRAADNLGCTKDFAVPLTALTPDKYVGQTVAGRPSFFWYQSESKAAVFTLYELAPVAPSPAKGPEKPSDKPSDKASDKPSDKPSDKASEKGVGKGTGKAADAAPAKPLETAPAAAQNLGTTDSPATAKRFAPVLAGKLAVTISPVGSLAAAPAERPASRTLAPVPSPSPSPQPPAQLPIPQLPAPKLPETKLPETKLPEPAPSKPAAADTVVWVKNIPAQKSRILQLPLAADKPELKADAVYRWEVEVICDPNQPSNKSGLATGFIQRVAPTAALSASLAKAKTNQAKADIYASAGLWYDTLDAMTRAIVANPNSKSLEQDFYAVLEQAGYGNIVAKERSAK